ncbi:MAG: flagellar basal body P-ring formation chaperone FlgA [Ramlibacter sp.]
MPVRSLFLSALAAAALVGLHGAHAQPVAVDENALRSFASAQVAGANGDYVSRFDVRIGSLDALAQVAPCRRSEPFLPSGARLWGRSSIGLRCVDGATWTVMLPVVVTAWGRAVVAATPLSAGVVLAATDLREGEVELTREGTGVTRDAQALAGRTLLRGLQPGQAVRIDMVRATPVVMAGDPVRLRILGAGFIVTSSGQAMNTAADGQSVRVRTELGKVLTGVAREGRQVEVTL